MQDRIRHIHFVGIGGVGMAGIAEVCLNLGYTVSGSDIQESANTTRLAALGARIFIGHSEQAVQGADVVVVSSAVPEQNPEIIHARAQRIPVIPRAMMLAELMRMRYGIAIAGTHGKTTTTSLTAAILTEGGLDPTYVIGGRLNQTGSHARLGASEYLVAEADESDASFLHLLPHMAVITNIEPDHMGTYGGDFEQLKETFVQFVQRLPFYGQLIVCNEDETIRQLLPRFERHTLTYGLDDSADLWAESIEFAGLRSHFVLRRGDLALPITLNMPGEHNVLNALAAAAVALELGVAPDAIARALEAFHGVGRRFNVYPQRRVGSHCVTLVDDYGHHPTEVGATLQAAVQAFPGQRRVLVFQLHRYSRTAEQFDRFVSELQQADCVILPPVYAAGEAPVPGADHRAIAQALRTQGYANVFVSESLEEARELAEKVVEDGDILLVLGAGNVGQLARQWQQEVCA
ncbi:UDP-N-acetylmuramate--L-alanine ligase [Sulfurivirga caldicuralii]|uniref:UDP-N-acetylmuramate--L-alanine ligase n=1 Tax=Sulfurivirga caldicuralii TaxID=364032 RepID=A0A1N6DVV4_9GAMM|nr:UDP-N-acetylmuramate--L-alanine ligase [Sulfurivirga caldicuralii]SIN74891.1 UDP-N-acetylmuramate--L-alanine ligase [Sulfurivirga caldicuralii]